VKKKDAAVFMAKKKKRLMAINRIQMLFLREYRCYFSNSSIENDPVCFPVFVLGSCCSQGQSKITVP